MKGEERRGRNSEVKTVCMLLSEIPFHLEIGISAGIGMQKLVLVSAIHNSWGNSCQHVGPYCGIALLWEMLKTRMILCAKKFVAELLGTEEKFAKEVG